jgi:uncharacterized OB-fold protein
MRLHDPCEYCDSPEECWNYAKKDGEIVGWFECHRAQPLAIAKFPNDVGNQGQPKTACPMTLYGHSVPDTTCPNCGYVSLPCQSS